MLKIAKQKIALDEPCRNQLFSFVSGKSTTLELSCDCCPMPCKGFPVQFNGPKCRFEALDGQSTGFAFG